MNNVISVAMGEMKTAHSPAVLQTIGVGSCLVVIIYDPVALVGGMAHAILPAQQDGSDNATPHRFVRESSMELIQTIATSGGRKDRLVAKLVGGAHMFSLLGDSVHGIGAQNIEQAHRTLGEQGVPIIAEETGGTIGRTVHFDLASCVCSVETHL